MLRYKTITIRSEWENTNFGWPRRINSTLASSITAKLSPLGGSVNPENVVHPFEGNSAEDRNLLNAVALWHGNSYTPLDEVKKDRLLSMLEAPGEQPYGMIVSRNGQYLESGLPAVIGLPLCTGSRARRYQGTESRCCQWQGLQNGLSVTIHTDLLVVRWHGVKQKVSMALVSKHGNAGTNKTLIWGVLNF
ncbi:hypothetical protein B0H12DRAFT_1079626 [Mycena haematopus]|nr:hypothetical protein B0H12DRAFT_1079626 [Mycena haematopus]